MGHLRAEYGPFDYAQHPRWNGWYFFIHDPAGPDAGVFGTSDRLYGAFKFGVYVTEFPERWVPVQQATHVRWLVKGGGASETRVQFPELVNLLLSRAPANVVLDAILEHPECPAGLAELVHQLDWTHDDRSPS